MFDYKNRLFQLNKTAVKLVSAAVSIRPFQGCLIFEGDLDILKVQVMLAPETRNRGDSYTVLRLDIVSKLLY